MPSEQISLQPAPPPPELESIPHQEAEFSEIGLEEHLQENELTYIATAFKDEGTRAALEQRYNDPRVKVESVMQQIADFEASRGLSPFVESSSPQDSYLNPENASLILNTLQEDLRKLLLVPEHHNETVLDRVDTSSTYQFTLMGARERKFHSLEHEAESFLHLVQQAQEEGDIPRDIPAGVIYAMIRENLAVLAFQDMVASENTLGDHGVRHLVDHNIGKCDQLFSELEKRGKKVPAIDRLLSHQIMTDHDLGYAMPPVREPINQEGIKGQDAGHNVLAAQFIRQRIRNNNSALTTLYTPEQLATVHEGILRHDSRDIRFNLDNQDPQARRQNILSAIHAADNCHAFDDKLPEILYASPPTLQYLYFMKVAHEIDEPELVDQLRQQMHIQFEVHPGLEVPEKEAFGKTVDSITSKSLDFTVCRIAGSKPILTITEDGVLHIEVKELALHQGINQLFNQEDYAQMIKFVKDLTGQDKASIAQEFASNKKQLDFKTDSVEITFDLQERKHATPPFGDSTHWLDESAGDETHFEKALHNTLKAPEFRTFIRRDLRESRGVFRYSTGQDSETTPTHDSKAVRKLNVEEFLFNKNLDLLQRLRAREGWYNNEETYTPHPDEFTSETKELIGTVATVLEQLAPQDDPNLEGNTRLRSLLAPCLFLTCLQLNEDEQTDYMLNPPPADMLLKQTFRGLPPSFQTLHQDLTQIKTYRSLRPISPQETIHTIQEKSDRYTPDINSFIIGLQNLIYTDKEMARAYDYFVREVL